MRGPGPTDHIFLYRNQALSKDLIHGRLKAAGERIGVHVHAHRLRHTCATQLLNSGCPVTSIQQFLGHKKLNTTMVYARAYDATVEADYFTAMKRVEERLQLGTEQPIEVIEDGERSRLLEIIQPLTLPELSYEQRLEITHQIQALLRGNFAPEKQEAWIPPPSLVLHEIS